MGAEKEVKTMSFSENLQFLRERSGMTQEQRENFYATMELIINNLSRYIADREE